MENTYLQTLERKLRELDEQREALLKLIAFERGGPSHAHTSKPVSSSSSVRGRIVDAIIGLIQDKGRQVRTEEILALIDDKKLSLGNTKNREASLAAILSQEIAKKSARLRRVERGVYDLK